MANDDSANGADGRRRPGSTTRSTGARDVPRVPWWHRLLAWAAASAVAYALASVAHTQTILAGLTALGVDVPIGTRLATTFGDLVGLWRYALVIAVAFALGLAIVQTLSRTFVSPPLVVRGLLVGTLAIAVALLAMRLALSFTPIASARGLAGFALQCLSGATGGLIWAGVRTALAARGRPPLAD